MGEVFWQVIAGKQPYLLSILRLISMPANTSVPGTASERNTQCSRQELLKTGLTSAQARLDHLLILLIEAIVMSLATIESTFATHTTNCIQGFDHAEYPVIRLALEVLNAKEGPIWASLHRKLPPHSH
jgi:hypothetical protein